MDQAKRTANPQHIVHADHMNYIQHMLQTKHMDQARKRNGTIYQIKILKYP